MNAQELRGHCSMRHAKGMAQLSQLRFTIATDCEGQVEIGPLGPVQTPIFS